MRQKIGVMFGSPDTTSGGNALKFYTSMRIEVSKGSLIKDSDGTILGNNIKANIRKNKTAPPFKLAEFPLYYTSGVDVVADVIRIAVEKNVIQKSGSWYSYGDVKLGQGTVAMIALLKDNEELMAEIVAKI